MATSTLADFAATSAWQNLVAAVPATASVSIFLQNKGDGLVQLVFGGDAPTKQDAGISLLPLDSFQGAGAAAIWIRAEGGDPVGVTLL